MTFNFILFPKTHAWLVFKKSNTHPTLLCTQNPNTVFQGSHIKSTHTKPSWIQCNSPCPSGAPNERGQRQSKSSDERALLCAFMLVEEGE
jgi:hypothetical protein